MAPSPNRLQLRGRLTRGAAWLVGIVAALFVVFLFANARLKFAMGEWLVLHPVDLFRRGQVWKLLTTSVMYPDAIGALLLDVLVIFFMIPMVERWWGTRRFVTFLLATSIVGNLASAMVGMAVEPLAVVFGLTPFIFASIVAFGVLNARQPVQLLGAIPMKGSTFAIGAAAIMLLKVLLDHAWVEGAGAFAAMGLAYVMTSGMWTPNLWWLKWKRWRVRRKLGVVDGGVKKSDKQKWVN